MLTTAANDIYVKNGEDLARYFLDRSGLSFTQGSCDMDDEEEGPTELNTVNSSDGFLAVSSDKLSVKYTNVNLHGHDVGVVQGDRPAPVKRLIYYFEIFVKDAGIKGQIAIGFTSENFKMRRQPGWEANSCGYHGDDGNIYRGPGKSDEFGPTYTSGDIVGGGINYASQEFFFTKNGALVGTVYKEVKGTLFPTIAVHSQNEEVLVNFGQKPFVFNLEEFEVQERMKLQMTIDKMSLPSNGFTIKIVRSYLQHYGYEDTLYSFDMETRRIVPPIYVAQENGFNEHEGAYALSKRKIIRQLIRNGDIDVALGKLGEWYPHIVQGDKSAACFLLYCQKFIELVRVGALEEAVNYGRMKLGKFFELREFQDLVKDCVALLAYQQPQDSSVGYLLDDAQREVVADTINAMILSTNSNLKDSQRFLHSYLEKLLRQLTACCLERRSVNGDQGEAFHLHRVIDSKTGDKSAACFLLYCQKFIELVRVGALEEAVNYGRMKLGKFFELREFQDLVKDCVALLAYQQPQDSSVGYLLDDAQREVVADTINAMILSTNSNLKDSQRFLHSYLEKLLRQLTACCLERRSVNGDQGEAFHLHRVIDSKTV